MTSIGKPYEGKLHVRFDEEGLVSPALHSTRYEYTLGRHMIYLLINVLQMLVCYLVKHDPIVLHPASHFDGFGYAVNGNHISGISHIEAFLYS